MEEKSKSTTETAFAHLRELISDIKVTMMTTIDQDGTLRSRPMNTEETDDDVLWFFAGQQVTDLAPHKRRDPRVHRARGAADVR